MRRNYFKLFLLLALSVTNFVRANFCAVEMAEFFERPHLNTVINKNTGSVRKRILLSRFMGDNGEMANVWED